MAPRRVSLKPHSRGATLLPVPTVSLGEIRKFEIGVAIFLISQFLASLNCVAAPPELSATDPRIPESWSWSTAPPTHSVRKPAPRPSGQPSPRPDRPPDNSH